VNEVWVANASPVIVLAKAGYLELLEQLPSELLLPEAVVVEVLAGPEADPARQALEKCWRVGIAPGRISSELVEWGLGPGETAVLALAQEKGQCTAVLDDAAARACAKAFRIPVIGTLGVVMRAKKRALIPQAGEVLRALRNVGLHLDDTTIRLSLGKLGEAWPP
jgi:predicted nucleic acid-binding protein